MSNSALFKCCPLLEKYKVLVFLSPLILLVIWVILEIINANEKLGREVISRTKHLESMRKRYQGLFDTIPEYVVLYRKNGEILDSNGRFSGILQGGNPIGANIIYMIREKDRFRNMITSLSDDEAVSFGEFLLKARDEQVAVSVNSCLVEIEGESAILSVMTDITDYKKMQNTFYLAQKREAVGTLAAGMVHDFSNILQNVSLQYSLLERSPESKRAENMQNIRDILSGANNYLTGVLSYTKDNKDEYEVKRGSEFIKESIELLERILPAEVSIDYKDTSENIKIRAVQSKMIQMLINLCQNASDAMNSKGIIQVRTYIEEKHYGHFFCLRVKDAGVGIKQEDIEKIYKPFYTTKSAKGTGLGLATVKQIVMDFGGFIEVESTPGVGTEFIIMFSEIQ